MTNDKAENPLLSELLEFLKSPPQEFVEDVERVEERRHAMARGWSRKRRQRLTNAPGSHTKQDVERIRQAQNNRCYYCDCDLGDYYEEDHKTPLCRNGSNGPENIVVTCHDCNQIKNSRTEEEFKRYRELCNMHNNNDVPKNA